MPHLFFIIENCLMYKHCSYYVCTHEPVNYNIRQPPLYRVESYFAGTIGSPTLRMRGSRADSLRTRMIGMLIDVWDVGNLLVFTTSKGLHWFAWVVETRVDLLHSLCGTKTFLLSTLYLEPHFRPVISTNLLSRASPC